ncbi:MAG: J domain-containing protein [Bdellovibrionales bacterium]|nr:J domain-containing protein [Bdellovibrionales bacterium]
MSINKDIIIRIGLALFIIIAFIKVVGPVIFGYLKKKIPGHYDADNDIDSMIRRQKNRLRSQYGITGGLEETVSNSHQERSSTLKEASESKEIQVVSSSEVQAFYKEARWGGGQGCKDIQSLITKNYSYTLTESKVNAFLLLAEKRNYTRFLSDLNQKSPDAIKNYLSLVLLVLILIEEIRNKEHNILEKVARKAKVSKTEFMLALQLNVLFTIAQKKPIKEERLFESVATLNQYSEETLTEATDSIFRKGANFWAKGHSSFFEELALYLSYADILTPFPAFQSKKDTKTAYEILKVDPKDDLDDIKKTYKKLAMTRHPDKIGHMNLPKTLEKKAHAKFSAIQEAYDIITTARKR